MNHLLSKTIQKERNKSESIMRAEPNEALDSGERPQAMDCMLTCLGFCRYVCGGCWTSNCVGHCSSFCGRVSW